MITLTLFNIIRNSIVSMRRIISNALLNKYFRTSNISKYHIILRVYNLLKFGRFIYCVEKMLYCKNPHSISIYLASRWARCCKFQKKYWNASIRTNMSLSANKSKKDEISQSGIHLNTIYDLNVYQILLFPF